MGVRESLDMALIFAAVEQNISLLFQGAAVNSLKNNQTPATANLKDYFKSLGTLEIYDVEQIYVCERSITRFNIEHTDLSIDTQLVDDALIEDLISAQDMVVTL